MEFRKAIYPTVAAAVLAAAPAIARAEGCLSDKIANVVVGVISPFYVIPHDIGTQALKGNDAVPILGAASGAVRGATYGVMDTVENTARVAFGCPIEDIENLGEAAYAFDSDRGGRIIITAATTGLLGLAASGGEQVVEYTVGGILAGAGAQGVEEWGRKDHPDRNDPDARRLTHDIRK